VIEASQPAVRSTIDQESGACASVGHGLGTDSNAFTKESMSVHSVRLTWDPSAPVAKSAGNTIIGYIVYRSTIPHDPKAVPINSTQVTGTTFIDRHVEPGKAYYYVTRAVNARGVLSPPSNEARAKIPR
jgi:hypothetical protein